MTIIRNANELQALQFYHEIFKVKKKTSTINPLNQAYIIGNNDIIMSYKLVYKSVLCN